MANVDVELGDVDIIQSTVQSLLDLVENEKNLPSKTPPSIYMVPSVFRDRSPTSFNPRVVSIGPLHREDEKLQEFEVYKASTVRQLLHRFKNSPPEQTLHSCVEKVNDSIGKIRDCYAGMKTYSDFELAKMMVMDGCFVLEFIDSFSCARPVVRNELLQYHLIYDLLLLENQIPFFVLNDIFHIFLKFGSEAPLSSFIWPVLNQLNPFHKNIHIENIGTDTTPHHILDLLHQCYRPRDNINDLLDFSSSSKYSAVDLDRAGVSFKPNKYAKWPLAMDVESHKIPKWPLAMDVESHKIPCLSWFWAKPILRMPVLKIYDDTELILRNLMAYEQSSLGSSLVSSYVIAMDMLVNTEEDIALLVESKVLVNSIGSNEEAANMMNGICKDIAWTDPYYNKQWKKLDIYYNGYWPKHVARLRRTYFGSPWNIIALVAGIVLFGLTVVQTICAIKEVGRG